ncbi:hypothetical protein EON73_04480 [bacterium]|nr:MAG: hypothetical protein EON73_04480 [bacterium]
MRLFNSLSLISNLDAIMKLLITACFVLIFTKRFSQRKTVFKIPDNLKYSAEDSVITDASSGTLKLYGNAKLQFKNVNIKADKVFFDQKNKQIIATGLQAYSFPFKLKTSLLNRKKILKYTLDIDTVFID